jgi:hypothetical protein
MLQNLRACVLQIKDFQDNIHGTGFIIDHNIAITCTHVIAAAGAKPGESLTVTFSLTGESSLADVLNDSWLPSDEEDIAILRIHKDLPQGVQPAFLGPSSATAGHTFLSFGFPQIGNFQGLWAEGKILGPITDDNNISMLQLRSQEIKEGMSGGPVLDTDENRIVGIVNATYYPQDETSKFHEAAFSTPIEVITKVLPSFKIPLLSSFVGLHKPVPTSTFDHAPSSINIQQNEELSGLRLKTKNELIKIESENKDWITHTRSFYFQRLLQTISEIESLPGRLEANRTLKKAVQISNAITNPTGRTHLYVCNELSHTKLFQLNWKLRRMLSRVIGDVIGFELGNDQQHLIGHFCEPRLYTPEGILLLAEAGSENTAAAEAIGESVIRRILYSSQPQAKWQLLRRWPNVSPVLSNSFNLNQINEVSSVNLKRMLFLTYLHKECCHHNKLKQLLGHVSESRDDDPNNFTLFHDALVAWLALNTSIDTPSHSTWTGPYLRINETLQTPNTYSVNDEKNLQRIAQSLELNSIEQDLRNMAGNYEPHPTQKYSEGRYGHTRHYVRNALVVVPSEHIFTLLLKLLCCTDEGVRWAVAAEVRNWWTLIPDSDNATSIVLRLINDKHPWVIRETLQQLDAEPLLCQAIGITNLTRNAVTSRMRVEAEGWNSDELRMAIRRITALDPYQVV